MFSLGFLDQVRATEAEMLASFLPAGARVLEFGAGTGEQAKILAGKGYDVVALDLAGSSYAGDRVFPVIDYDGTHIPLPDRSIDAIMSSNVLEHVEDLEAILAEFLRVLRPGGLGVHAMPTPAWRFWTFVSGVPSALQALAVTGPHLVSPPRGTTRKDALARNLKTVLAGLLPIGHGTSREGISELWTFSPRAWARIFERNGWRVVEQRPMGLFYTGHMSLGPRLSFERRRQLAGALGSAAQIYVVRPMTENGTQSNE